MKKALSIFLILFCCLLFAGCSECTYVVEYKANGNITQTFTTVVDKQQLQEKGFSYTDLYETINNIYATYWASKQSSMLANLNNNSELSATQRTEIYNSVTKDIEVLENGLTLTITYPSSYIANLVNNDPTQEETPNNNTYKHTWFTTTLVQNVTNIYNGYNETQLYNQLYSVYSTNNAFSDADLHLKQVMAFSTPRYKSNSQQVVKNEGLYYHIWNINSTKDQNGEVASTKLEIYYTTAKPLAC